MALTVVTSPPAIDKTQTIGAPFSTTVRYSSDIALAGTTIQLRVAAFANPADPFPAAIYQAASYAITYPSGPFGGGMVALSGLHPTKHIYSVIFTYVDGQTFDITVKFLMSMDQKDFWDTTAIDNVFRFEKNVIDNPFIDDNGLVSAYNQTKELRIEATHYVSGSTTSAVYSQQFQPRFWCTGNECCDIFYDCITNPVNGWSYQLYQGTQLVNGFSAFNTINIKFSASFNAGNTPVKYWVGVYRKDSYTNLTNYWTDIDFSYAVFDPTMAGLSPSPFSTAAFLPGGSAMTNILGDVWQADIALDQNYFVPGATYRAFIVVEDDTGYRYSCNTEDIIASGIPDVTIADITPNAWQYDSASTTYTADYIINVATRGRIRIDMRFDKDSYNANIITNGLAGNYNTNLEGFGRRVMDTYPTATHISSNNEIPLTRIIESASIDVYRTEFQVPESWSGKVKYIVFIWQFQITIGLLTYTDQIRKVVKLKMRINDEISTNIFMPDIYNDSDEIIENTFCADEFDALQICFTEAQETSYDFIQVTRLGSGAYIENDEYTQTPMSVKTNPLIQTAESDTIDSDGCLTINLEDLVINSEYQIGGVFIDHAGESLPTCDDIDYESTLTFVSQNDYETVLTFEFDLDPLNDNDVSQVEINYRTGYTDWQQAVYFDMAQSDAPLTIIDPESAPFVLVQYEVNITLASGCQYRKEYVNVLATSTPGATSVSNYVLSPI